jgi:hypothetical protein
MNKPSWGNSPEWAKYLAMDDCGTWCWYEEKPEYCHGFWFSSAGLWVAAANTLPEADVTLEARPE